MHDKLVHMPRLFGEPRDAIAALLRAAKLILKQRVIQGANNGEVEGHYRIALYCASKGVPGLVVVQLTLESLASADWLPHLKAWRADMLKILSGARTET